MILIIIIFLSLMQWSHPTKKILLHLSSTHTTTILLCTCLLHQHLYMLLKVKFPATTTISTIFLFQHVLIGSKTEIIQNLFKLTLFKLIKECMSHIFIHTIWSQGNGIQHPSHLMNLHCFLEGRIKMIFGCVSEKLPVIRCCCSILIIRWDE
mmetsp:Transcript_9427/g.14021  ORF Transcript_9427/g.14021 Transcript_9427/m.14021 type:complete len:152 (+) Transcript_9427:1040-1495(+)